MKKTLLPVYYGWAKLNKVVKREALTVIFLNDHPGPRIGRDGHDGVTRFIEICAQRYQTEKEIEDAKHSNRIYSVYSIFMDDKQIKGSLQKALYENSESDKNNVNKKERQEIEEKLREAYMRKHPQYKEPTSLQLEIEFNE